MQKILNQPEDYVDQVLDGVVRAHGSILRGRSPHTLRYDDAESSRVERVAIVTGGGSGHMPLFAGYLGAGLVDGAAVGQVFASPSSDAIYSIATEVHRGAGIFFLYGNYQGDRLNFERATERLAEDGVAVRSVRAADDVASSPRTTRARRRGVAGIALLYKIAGAAARRGVSLDELVQVVEDASEDLATMGVALSGCTLPAVGRPNFAVPAGEMELGMGLHGEPGVQRVALASADEIVDRLLDHIVTDLSGTRGEAFDVLVNGLGATTLEELYIMYSRCGASLDNRGISVRRAWIGEFATSMEMAGASISLMRVNDERARLLDDPVSAPILER